MITASGLHFAYTQKLEIYTFKSAFIHLTLFEFRMGGYGILLLSSSEFHSFQFSIHSCAWLLKVSIFSSL